MKIWSIILSIIFVVLSCLPCADGADVSTKKTNVAAASQDSHSKEHGGDLCSPFCICNCCGVQILSFTPSLAFHLNTVPADFTSKPEIAYKSHLASMFSGSIWQPPKIS